MLFFLRQPSEKGGEVGGGTAVPPAQLFIDDLLTLVGMETDIGGEDFEAAGFGLGFVFDAFDEDQEINGILGGELAVLGEEFDGGDSLISAATGDGPEAQ